MAPGSRGTAWEAFGSEVGEQVASAAVLHDWGECSLRTRSVYVCICQRSGLIYRREQRLRQGIITCFSIAVRRYVICAKHKTNNDEQIHRWSADWRPMSCFEKQPHMKGNWKSVVEICSTICSVCQIYGRIRCIYTVLANPTII